MDTNKITIQELIKIGIKTPEDLALVKRKIAKKYKISLPKNSELLTAYHKLVKNGSIKKNRNLENLLRIRKIRSLSGIVVISVLTKPYPCPGKCVYCPQQRGIPKSYLEGEPAVMRAILNKFDPYLQVQSRIRALKATGHATDKIELRIIGGTWSYYPSQYQTWFIKRCFEACNEFDQQRNLKIKMQKVKSQRKIQNLELAQKINEEAKYRIVGQTIETRPDFITESEIKRLRKLGVTRVELGVQSIYDDILKLNNRGHDVQTTVKATRLLKEAGFKICYQMMPNLPGSDFERDKKMFEEIFANPDFRPDFLKIYPCALLKEAPLYRWWKNGKYRPYSKKTLIKLLKEIKKKIPYYVRIQRVIRDFPSPKIIKGGTKTSNLRQILAEISKREGFNCKCIRCREVKENYNPQDKLYLFREDYQASGGKEIFLSFETKNQQTLYSLLRLRIPSHFYLRGFPSIFSVLKDAAIIREVHTYGQLHPLIDEGSASLVSPQHKGLGKKLITEAEKIAKEEFGLNKIAVISAVGTRNYYRKLGYQLKETYMVKKL